LARQDRGVRTSDRAGGGVRRVERSLKTRRNAVVAATVVCRCSCVRLNRSGR